MRDGFFMTLFQAEFSVYQDRNLLKINRVINIP